MLVFPSWDHTSSEYNIYIYMYIYICIYNYNSNVGRYLPSGKRWHWKITIYLFFGGNQWEMAMASSSQTVALPDPDALCMVYKHLQIPGWFFRGFYVGCYIPAPFCSHMGRVYQRAIGPRCWILHHRADGWTTGDSDFAGPSTEFGP